MKKIITILFSQLLLSLILAYLFNDGFDSDGFLTVFGLMNLIVGFLGLFAAGLMKLFGDENIEISKRFLAASGILLLIGCGVCSQFPIRLH